MNSSTLKFVLATLLLFGLLGAPAREACAQELSSSPAEQRVRRLLVPEKEIDDFLEERSGYYSLNREDFEEKLADFKAESKVAQPARIARAFLFGKLTAGGKLSGEIYLEVENEKSTTQTISIGEVNLMLSQAAWLDTTGTEAQRDSFANPDALADVPDLQRALVGNDSDGELRLITASSGLVRLQWRYPELLDPADTAFKIGKAISLALPKSTALTIQIVVPSDLDISAESCKVLRKSDGDSNSVQPDFQTFLIHCGTNHNPKLRIKSKSDDADIPTPRYEENVAYEVSREGLNFESVLKFETPASRDQLRIDLGDAVVCRSVFAEGIEVPFQVITNESRSQVMIAASEIEAGTISELRLACFAPIRMKERTNLPRVKVAGARWFRGSGELKLPSDIEFSSFKATGAVATPRSDVASGNSIALSAFQENWSVATSWREVPGKTVIDSICIVNANSTSLAADQHVLFTTETDSIFNVTATIPKHWILDSVTAVELGTEQPLEKLIDYWDTTEVDKVFDRFFVQFSRPVSKDRPIVLRFKGHRFLADNKPLTFRNFNMLRFASIDGHDVEKNLHICVRERANTQIEFGRGSSFPTPLALDAIAPTLITQAGLKESDRIFELDGRDSQNARLSLDKPSAQEFDATIASQMDVSRRRIRETTSIKLHPVAGQIRVVKLRAIGDVDGIKWEFAADDSSELSRSVDANSEFRNETFSIRKIVETQVNAPKLSDGADGETEKGTAAQSPAGNVHTWELRFRSELPPSFVLTASRVRRVSDQVSALRFHVPAARVESATLLAGSTNNIQVEFPTSNFKSIPASQQERAMFQRLAGKVRLNREGSETLKLKVSDRIAENSGIVEKLSVAWKFDSHDSVTVARWLIRNRSTSDFEFRLPPKSQLQSVRLNESSISATEIENGFSVQLPNNESLVEVEVVFLGPAPPSRWINDCQQLPETDLPVVEVSRSILLGNGWIAAEEWRPLDYQSSWPQEIQDRLLGGLSPFLFKKTKQEVDHVGFTFAPSTQEKMLAFGRKNISEQSLSVDSPNSEWFATNAVVNLKKSNTRPMLVNARRLAIVRWLLMITSFCLAMTAIFNRRRWQILFAGILLAGCLIAPLLFSPLFAAAFWGIVVAMLIRALQAALFGEPMTEPSDQNTTALMQDAATIIGTIIALLCCLSVPHLIAQESGTSQPQRIYHDIVVPIDDKGNGSGNVVYVPKKLYSMLTRQKNSDPSLRTKSLLSSARFVAKMSRDNFTDEARVENITATLKFRSAQNAETITLPFDTGKVLVNRESIRLDSIKTKMLLASDGRGFVIDAPDYGEHELVFEFLPTTNDIDSWTEFDFAVPVVHDTRFSVEVDSDLRGYRIESDLTGDRDLNSSDKIQLVPGPTGKIALRWVNKLERESTDRKDAVDQLMTMEVERDEVLFQYSWSRDLKLGEVDESFEISINDDLELIEDRSSRLLSERAETRQSESGKMQSGRTVYTFACDRFETSLNSVAQFRRRGTSLGTFLLPDVQVSDARLQTNLLAIMRTPTLSIEPVSDSRMLVSDSRAAFVRSWNRWGQIDDAKISTVFRVDDAVSELAWRIAPLIGNLAVNAEMQMNAGIAGSKLVARVDLDYGDEPGSYAKFHLPSGYVITKVEVDSRSVAGALTILDRNQCTILLDDPRESMSLKVQASANTKRSLSFPLLKFEGADRTDHRFALRREQNCDAKTKVSDPWRPDESIAPDAIRNLKDDLRLVGIWETSQKASNGEATSQKPKPSTVQIQGRMHSREGIVVTSVRDLQGDLLLEIDCFPSVGEKAKLDQIEVRFVGKLPGEFVASEAGKVTVTKSPFSDERLVVFIPETPLKNGSRITLQTGPIQVGMRLPVVTWTNFANDRAWLRLFRTDDEPAVAWKQTNLTEVAMARIKGMSSAAKELLLQDEYRVFRTSRNLPVVELAVTQQRQRELVIPLQVTTVHWNGGNSWLGNCALDLSATESAELIFEHSEQTKVADVQLDGTATQFIDDGEQCRVIIPASDFPRRLMIALQGQTNQSTLSGKSHVTFDGLTLLNNTVGEKFVKVSVPNSIAPTNRDIWNGEGVESEQLVTMSVSELVAVSSLAPDLSRPHESADLDRAAWIASIQQRVNQLLITARNGQLSDFDRSRLDEANARLDLIRSHSANLESSPEAANELRSIGRVDSQLEQESFANTDKTSNTYVWQIESDAPSTSIVVNAPQKLSGRNHQWLWLIAIGSLCVAFVFSRKQSWAALRKIGPQAALVALALFGWFWTVNFNPPIVGWLMGVAALVVGIRSMFRNRTLRRQQAAVRNAQASSQAD